MDAKLKAFQPLIGVWRGDGRGPQGPFEVQALFEERGRWILLRHEIRPPGSEEAFYVSTQVFGYDDEGLTLDYFDTAGAFHFSGKASDSGFSFAWNNDGAKSGDLWKASTYEFDGSGGLTFKYQSCEQAEQGDPAVLEFSGRMTKNEASVFSAKQSEETAA